MNHRWWVGNDAGDVHSVGNSWHLKMSFNGFAPFVLAERISHGVEEGLPWMTFGSLGLPQSPHYLDTWTLALSAMT